MQIAIEGNKSFRYLKDIGVDIGYGI